MEHLQTIEIRYEAKFSIKFFKLMAPIFIVFAAYSIYSDIKHNQLRSSIFQVPVSLFWLFVLYRQIRVWKKNEPVLTFRAMELAVNYGGKKVSYNWQEIKSWQIKNDYEDGDILILEFARKKKEISLKTLEKSAKEIEELMRVYRGE